MRGSFSCQASLSLSGTTSKLPYSPSLPLTLMGTPETTVLCRGGSFGGIRFDSSASFLREEALVMSDMWNKEE